MADKRLGRAARKRAVHPAQALFGGIGCQFLCGFRIDGRHVDDERAGLRPRRDAILAEDGNANDFGRIEAENDHIGNRRCFRRCARALRAEARQCRHLFRIQIEDRQLIAGLYEPCPDRPAHGACADQCNFVLLGHGGHGLLPKRRGVVVQARMAVQPAIGA